MSKIRRVIGVILVLAFIGLMTSCGTKRSVAKRTQQKQVKTVEPRQATYDTADHLYPLPTDDGRFVNFNIESTTEYIETFASVAQDEMKAYGIPASITLAQGLLESGFGKSTLAKKTNNHFGIKCHTGWNGEYDLHDDDAKDECFRKYNHPMYSFRDHSIFLTTRGRYAFLFDLRINDYKGWAKGLKKAGYATDPKYPNKLIYLVEKHGLDKYDLASHKIDKQEPRAYVYRKHIVEAGETLYAISKMYFMSVSDLKKLNELKSNTISTGKELTVKALKIKSKE